MCCEATLYHKWECGYKPKDVSNHSQNMPKAILRLCLEKELGMKIGRVGVSVISKTVKSRLDLQLSQ